MPGTKCPTVRSGGTTRLRSALMPTLITSRASMEFLSSLSRKGRGKNNQRLLLRHAFDEGHAALHLVDQRRFVDLDHDGFGIDAEILHQRLRDIAHHADLLFLGASGGHADRNFGHVVFLFPYCKLSGACTDLILRSALLVRVSKDGPIVLMVRDGATVKRESPIDFLPRLLTMRT